MFLQGSLFGACAPEVDEGFVEAQRIELDERSWVEHVPGWLNGSDGLFDELLDRLDLRQRTNIAMYDRVVDEPRLTAWWSSSAGAAEYGPTVLLDRIGRLLAERYHRPFDSIGFNLYRNGEDSVAWHGDRHRHHVTDPVVAILSVGEPRPLKLRPRRDVAVPTSAGDEDRGSAPRSRSQSQSASSWALGRGDLFVMGGACQHEWEHCVPKLRRSVGPRMSITFRHDARSSSWSPERAAATTGQGASSGSVGDR